MNPISEVLLSDAHTAYLRRFATLQGKDELLDALAAWLLPDSQNEPRLTEIALKVSQRTGGERTYRDVAVLGFLGAARFESVTSKDALKSGLIWISDRPPYVEGSPTGICTDGVALFGIALGTLFIVEVDVKKRIADWLGGFASDSSRLPALPTWQKFLFGSANRILGNEQPVPMAEDDDTADVRIALLSKGIGQQSDEGKLAHAELATLQVIRDQNPQSIEAAQIPIRLAAYRWIRTTTSILKPSRATAPDVMQLLARLENAFQKWTWEEKARTNRKGAEPRKWHVENEYHLQNLLWFLLAPLFPDLREEEYLKSVGQLQPRADLCIPSLRLIIEAKYMYSTTTPQDMIQQIASDAGLYLTEGSGFETIIPVIWDDRSRVEDHHTLRRGLTQLRGILDAVIVSRPGMMRT